MAHISEAGVRQIYEICDRYAGEIMRYRFDQMNMKEKEAVGIGLDSK